MLDDGIEAVKPIERVGEQRTSLLNMAGGGGSSSPGTTINKNNKYNATSQLRSSPLSKSPDEITRLHERNKHICHGLNRCCGIRKIDIDGTVAVSTSLAMTQWSTTLLAAEVSVFGGDYPRMTSPE